MDEQAKDKVVAKACDWATSRQAKASTTGPAKERARSRHLMDGNALAEAVEAYRKSQAKER